jgi:predicted MPP superfamily phosphohydrolase
MFLCEGNHDLNPGPGLVYNACVQQGFSYLRSSHAILNIGGKRLVLGGVPWLGDEQNRRFDRNAFVEGIVASAFPTKQEGDVRVLLAHHPHYFESAMGVDVVLSGHTHGGQIMIGDVGVGSVAFRYWTGKYVREKTTLVVSNGCGDWFPCRIGAPAEVGLLKLVRRAG